MPHQPAALVERLRAMLANQAAIREVVMFGGRSFMVDDRMIASARRTGDLLVRVAPERDDELVEKPGAKRAEMGAGRSMGRGWVSVSADSITNDAQLSFWIGVALEHHQTSGTAVS